MYIMSPIAKYLLNLFLLICIMSLPSGGCVGIEAERGVNRMKVERGVKDNLFHSSELPKIDVRVDQRFDYVGKHEGSGGILFGEGSRATQCEGYYFVSVGDNPIITRIAGVKLRIIKKLAAVEIYRTSFSYHRLTVKNQLDSGITRIDGSNYQWAIFTTNRLLPLELAILFQREEYRSSDHSLVRVLANSPRDGILVCILYAEDLSYNISVDTLNAFSSRSQKAIQVVTPSFAGEFVPETKKLGEPQPAEIEGLWLGKYESISSADKSGNECGSGAIKVYVSDNEVTGTASDSAENSYIISGSSIEGETIDFQAKGLGESFMTFTGHIKADALSGVWQNRKGCYGSWRANHSKGK